MYLWLPDCLANLLAKCMASWLNVFNYLNLLILLRGENCGDVCPYGL
jgi:hypothetical protein